MNRMAFRDLVLAQGPTLSAKTEAYDNKERGGICADIPRNVGGLGARSGWAENCR